MIKMHSKKIGAVLVVAGLLASMAALAEDSSNPTSSNGNNKTKRVEMIQEKQAVRQENRTQNVCEKISNLTDDLSQKASGQEERVRTRQAERLTNWENKIGQVDAKLAATRASWEKNRDDQFAALETKAGEDAQKLQAVKNFEATAKEAIAKRKATVDAAIKAFRDGVHSAITTRQGQTDGVVSSFVSGRSAAIKVAEDDCAAGKDAATVRADFQNALKNARTQFQSERKNVTKVSANIESLIQTRRAAVEEAMSEFKATMEKARTELKKAFPNETDTSDKAE